MSSPANSVDLPAGNVTPVVRAERKAKIAFLVSHSSAGGVQEICANLAEGFLERGYASRLHALYPLRADIRATSPELPWNYIVPKRPSHPLALMALLAALIRFFRTEVPDILLTAMPAANVLAPIAARIAGARTRIFISHHSPVETHNPLLNWLDGLSGSLPNVAGIISVSNTVAQSLERKPDAYRRKRKTILNALPPRIETLIDRLKAERAPLPAGQRRVMATGRLASQKNYPVLIRAARHMPGVEIEIAGTGPDEAALKELAQELGVAERIRFLGHLPRETALARLSGANVFVQPSLFEGHSLALIEAARLELPLVVSDVPVQIEGVTAPDGDTCAQIVPVHDDRKLANALLAVLDPSAARDDWVRRARHLGDSARFSAMLDSYEALFRS